MCTNENLVASLPQIIESRKTKEHSHVWFVSQDMYWMRDIGVWTFHGPINSANLRSLFEGEAFHNDKVKKRNKNYNVTLLGSWEEGSQSISLRLEVSPSDVTTVTLPSSSDSTLGSAARNVIQ